jgi:hypothetical protein
VVFIRPSGEKFMIKTRIATIIAIAKIGVIVNSAVASLPKTYAQGGLMGLVAHAAQDVYDTGPAQVNMTKYLTKFKFDLSKLRSEETKLQPASVPQTSAESGGSLVAVPAQDVDQLQSDMTKIQSQESKLQSQESKLQSDMTKIQSEANKTSAH